MATLLRALTLSAVSTLLMIAPLAGAGTTPAAHDVRADTGQSSLAGRAPALPVTGLPTGPRPTIAFARASRPAFLGGNFRVHRPDGTTFPIGYLADGAWSTLGRGAFGTAVTEAGAELQRVRADGTVVRQRFLHHFGIAVSPDHTIVGWLDDRNRPHDLEGGGSRELTLPRVAQGDGIGAVWGAKTCQEQAPEGGGCTIFVNAAHHAGTYVSTSHGIVDRVGPMLHASDVNQRGRVVGLASRRTATRGACWGVFGPDGHRVWQTCRYRLTSFSTDGRRVLGVRLDPATGSATALAVFRRDGSVARAYSFEVRPNRLLLQPTWEDPTHVLAVVKAARSWSVVRIGVDGAVEYAVAPRPSVNEFTPLSLPQR